MCTCTAKWCFSNSYILSPRSNYISKKKKKIAEPTYDRHPLQKMMVKKIIAFYITLKNTQSSENDTFCGSCSLWKSRFCGSLLSGLYISSTSSSSTRKGLIQQQRNSTWRNSNTTSISLLKLTMADQNFRLAFHLKKHAVYPPFWKKNWIRFAGFCSTVKKTDKLRDRI